MKKEKADGRMKMMIAGAFAAVILSVAVFTLFTSEIVLQEPLKHTSNNVPLFKWQSFHDYTYYELLVDDNPQFSSPIIEKTTDTQYRLNGELPLGTYYWKVTGHERTHEAEEIIESDVKEFALESVVSVARTEYGLRNTANIVLVANLFARSLFTGKIILDINKILQVNETVTEVEASQK